MGHCTAHCCIRQFRPTPSAGNYSLHWPCCMNDLFSFPLGFTTLCSSFKTFLYKIVFWLECACQGFGEPHNTRWYIQGKDSLSCPLGTVPKPVLTVQSTCPGCPKGMPTNSPAMLGRSPDTSQICAHQTPRGHQISAQASLLPVSSGPGECYSHTQKCGRGLSNSHCCCALSQQSSSPLEINRVPRHEEKWLFCVLRPCLLANPLGLGLLPSTLKPG